MNLKARGYFLCTLSVSGGGSHLTFLNQKVGRQWHVSSCTETVPHKNFSFINFESIQFWNMKWFEMICKILVVMLFQEQGNCVTVNTNIYT
jgi:hypothetical protein